MTRRLRLIRPEQQPQSLWYAPKGIGVLLVLCVLLIAFMQVLPSLFLQPESSNESKKEQAAPTEMRSVSKDDRPKVTPKAFAALSAEEEAKLLGQVEDQAPLEAKPYFYMLAKVNAMSREQIDAAVDPAVTYETFVDAPASARGKVVKLEGLLKRLKETKIIDNLTAGFDSVWEGTIIDNDLRPIEFILTQAPPPNFLTVDRDRVVLKGVFLKNRVYRSRGGDFMAAPMIIAKELVKVVPPPVKESAYGRVVLFFVIVVAVVGFVFWEHQRRMRAAIDRRRGNLEGRRGIGELPEHIELVPDSEAKVESSSQVVEHVNPGPGESELKKTEDGGKA